MRAFLHPMAELKHQHGINQDENQTEKPPRAHVERTRDVFRDAKGPTVKEQPQPLTKVKSRRAAPEQQKKPKEKKERNQIARDQDGNEDEVEEDELTPEERRAKDLLEHEEQISYSNYYYDDEFEYRHVTLPKEIAQWIPHKGLLSDDEWRSLGVKQSLGWEHYMVHAPEPHVLLFKRVKNYQKKFPSKKSKEQAVAQSNTTKVREQPEEWDDSKRNSKQPRVN